MADVINRITGQYLRSVNTPDYPISDWIINPMLPDCDPSKWVVEGDLVREITQAEKDAKIAESQAEQNAKNAEEALEREELKKKKIKNREDFISLSIEDKLLYLYDTR